MHGKNMKNIITTFKTLLCLEKLNKITKKRQDSLFPEMSTVLRRKNFKCVATKA